MASPGVPPSLQEAQLRLRKTDAGHLLNKPGVVAYVGRRHRSGLFCAVKGLTVQRSRKLYPTRNSLGCSYGHSTIVADGDHGWEAPSSRAWRSLLPLHPCPVSAPGCTCGNYYLLFREVERLAQAHSAAKGEQDSNPDLPDSKAYPPISSCRHRIV